MALFTWEYAYGASAGRAALTALVPAPSPSLTISGTNWMEAPRKARILKNTAAITDTIANVDAGEYAINASHDPNYIRNYAFRDQTAALYGALQKHNYPLIDAGGNTAIFRALENNDNVAEIVNLYFALGDESFKGLTHVAPDKLPGNARTMTATATITSVLGQWASGALTLNGSLNPKQRYAIYGAGCTSLAANTLSGFRFVPKSSSTPADLYPGALASDIPGGMVTYFEKTGEPWIVFEGSQLPDLAISAMTAAAQAPVVQIVIAEVQ